jgi:DNA-binding IclR family transcriptional regulator
LKAATAARIVQTLAKLGYLEQLGRKTGYVLGGKSFALSRNRKFSPPLLDAAMPYMQKFSEATGEYIALSVLRGGTRVILHNIMSTKPIQVSGPIIMEETPYRSLAGRMLLANLPVEKRKALLEKLGLPGSSHWAGIATMKELEDALSALGGKDLVVSCKDEMAVAGATIKMNGSVCAIIGSFLPGYRFKGAYRKELALRIEEAAKAISGAINAERNREGMT